MVELGITTVGVEECEYGTPASPQVGFAETDGPVGKDGDRDIVTITFGTGEMSGMFVRDRICIGDICPARALG